MPRFIVTGCYTAAALKGMAASPSDRAAASNAIVEAAGGTQEAYYMTTGETDFMIVVNVDDVSELIAGLIAVGGTGAVSGLKTVRAFSAEEFTAMQKRAGEIASSYKPPA